MKGVRAERSDLVTASHARREETGARRPQIVVAGVVLLAFTLNFGAYRVFGDGVDYYSFLQRLFGERSTGSGYNFGVGLMNAPFFAVAKGVHLLVRSGSLATHVEPASITIASICYAVVAFAVSVWLVAQLGLPHAASSALAAVFGSPLWYYASFSPSYSHAADAAAFSAAAAGLYLLLQSPALRWRLLTGAALGLAVAVRPFNAALIVGLCIALVVIRRVGDAAKIVAAAAATFGMLVVVPLALGTGLETRANGERLGTHTLFAPLNPLRILFTLHRGLFLWTPATLLAVIGIALLLRRRDPARLYVGLLTSMVAALLCAYSTFGVWDAGWSFSARYLAAPIPFYAIGISSLLGAGSRRIHRVTACATVVTVAFSVFLGMNHAFGASQADGANNIVGYYFSGKRTIGDFFHLTWSYSRVRHLVHAG